MNNRQAGRRRGRGGQRPQGGGNANGQGNGNRIDNRARGNAAQLLEKYKNLARDAQMQGDRVNTEYYLQFADHYFRVLAETRSRFEENQGTRRPREGADDGEDFEFENEGDRVDGPQHGRDDRGDDGRNGQYNGNGHANGNYRADEGDEFEPRDDRATPRQSVEPSRDADRSEPRRNAEPREDDRPRRAEPRDEGRGQPRRNNTNNNRRPARETFEAEPQGIDAAILPPALGVEAAPQAEDAEAEKPRRRGRPRRDADAPIV